MRNENNQQPPPVLDYRSAPPTAERSSDWQESPLGYASLWGWLLMTFGLPLVVVVAAASRSITLVMVLASAAPPLGVLVGLAGLIRDRSKWAAFAGILLNALYCFLAWLLLSGN